MATFVNKEDCECYPRLTLIKPDAVKQIRNAKPKVDHAKEAKRIKKVFNENGIEITRANNLW